MMSRSLLGAVWKCVSDDRVPRPIELNSLVTKILREAFNDEDTPVSYRRAEMLAHAALEGQSAQANFDGSDDSMIYYEGDTIAISF
jgi:hypothetical protein